MSGSRAWAWVDAQRWPERATRFRECEHMVTTSDNKDARRIASAELGRILADAEANAV
ncbi:hypothetical protein [Streptomyces akebiae]|uniref:Uncharacterized protein n=1 Tax=Streptomyces akebiae TaxID=2865673 RepID=A0ABX8XR94_9ACTN|nr:hypothetical protein [Streptomyces akebiae]QYX77781.1 hypothetical protein K1J60_15690 [Streptomyces akebiae]